MGVRTPEPKWANGCGSKPGTLVNIPWMIKSVFVGMFIYLLAGCSGYTRGKKNKVTPKSCLKPFPDANTARPYKHPSSWGMTAAEPAAAEPSVAAATTEESSELAREQNTTSKQNRNDGLRLPVGLNPRSNQSILIPSQPQSELIGHQIRSKWKQVAKNKAALPLISLIFHSSICP